MQKPRIAIPVPTSASYKPGSDYNARALPQYVGALESFGAAAVPIALELSNPEIARLAASCQGVLLPGSPADVDPEKFGAARDPRCNPADVQRDNADELLLQDAFNMHKPLLGICYGLQSLNVWRSGTLVQHIESAVNHEAGKGVAAAHEVELAPASRLARIVGGIIPRKAAGETRKSPSPPANPLPVNSSHHQSAQKVGDGLELVAWCPEDNVVEAVEGTDPRHFVLGVQWHPERSYQQDAASQAIFRAFVEAARSFEPRS